MQKIKGYFYYNIGRLIELKSKPIFHQFSWYFLNTTITQLLSFVSVLFVYRYLGPVNVGIMSFVSNFILGLFFIGAAIDTFVYWNLLKYDGERNQIKFIMRICHHRLRILIILAISGILFSYFYVPRDLVYLLLAGIIPTIVQTSFSFGSYFNLHKKVKVVSIFGIISSIFFFICKMLAVYYKLPVLYFILINFIDFAFLFYIYYILDKKILFGRDFIENIPSLSDTFRFLWQLKVVILYVLTLYLFIRIDQLLLSVMGNAYRLGIYAGAVKIVEISNLFLGVLTATVGPYIANNYKNYNETLSINNSENKLEKKLLWIFILLSVLMVIFIIVFSTFIVNILFGNNFTDSIPVLFWYAPTIISFFIINYYVNIYSAKNKYLDMSIIFIISCIINAGLIYILFPIYGLKGVAIATVIAYFVSAILLWYNYKK